jgi:hypothetical protein
MNRSSGTMVFWLGLFALVAIGLTVASFFALVVPDDRGQTFYSVMVSLCVAELVLFGYSAYMLTVPQTVTRPSPAVRMRIMVLVVIWFLIILISGAVAVHPDRADTFYGDKIILFQCILTFLFLMGAFFFHWQDVSLQVRDAAPQRERVHIQSYTTGMDDLLTIVRRLEDQYPESAVDVDRLAKKLDSLKTQLLTVSPVAQRPTERLVQPVDTEQIEQQLREIHETVKALADAAEGEVAEKIRAAGGSVDDLAGLLRRREDVISF